MDVLLETKNLIVKKPSLDALDNSVALHLDRDVRRLMYTKAKDAAEVKEWIRFNMNHQAHFGYSIGSVYEKKRRDFIGRAGLIHVENNFDHPEIEVDCYLQPLYWGKGYGKELLQAFFQWGADHFSFEKIVAVVYSINDPAIQLANSVGMKYIGIKKYLDADFLWFEKYL